MTLRSNPDRYGTVAVVLHWTSAALILGLTVAGMRAASIADPAAKAAILRIHVPVGILVLLLTLTRIGWWLFADRKPAEIAGMPRLQAVAARAVHRLLYVALLGLALSGIALMTQSRAGEVLFGGASGPLPDFWTFRPRYAHATLAVAMVVLLVLHIGGALYHHFARRDQVFRRIGLGR